MRAVQTINGKEFFSTHLDGVYFVLSATLRLNKDNSFQWAVSNVEVTRSGKTLDLGCSYYFPTQKAALEHIAQYS